MTKINKAVVLAAGRGTRMRELTTDLPKPMIAVRGKPVLQHIVEGLRDAGIQQFFIIVGYRGDTVRSFFGDGSRCNVAIGYTTQTVQDGTGRVVNLARDFVGDSPFVLSYGDIFVDPTNYKRVVDLPDNVEAIVTVTRGENVSKGGAVYLNEQMELIDIREKVQPMVGTARRAVRTSQRDVPTAATPAGSQELAPPSYNAGIYAFRPSIFEFTAKLKLSPRGEYELTDAIRELAHSGKKVQALELTGEWADVRDPEVLARLNS